jgi:hypothetical protein
MASEHGNLELYIRYVQPFRAIPNFADIRRHRLADRRA